ncbi:unnamed protein product [Gongylonema pulchrum]|uniref:DNA methylase n=1 Tax=Gongylonema pulchrum TaxID=637853 RepID=A0A183CW63_9BILA|nr:unnamed protein product [Gongylonema pulchrum]
MIHCYKFDFQQSVEKHVQEVPIASGFEILQNKASLRVVTFNKNMTKPVVPAQESFGLFPAAAPQETQPQSESESAQEQFINQLESNLFPEQEARRRAHDALVENMMPLFRPFRTLIEYDDKYKGRFINTDLGRLYLACQKCPARGR